MAEKKSLPVALQTHHLAICRANLQIHSDPKAAAQTYAKDIAARGLHYADTASEFQEFQLGLELAHQAVHSENYIQALDGTPDAICMGCSRPDCRLVQRREAAKKTWPVMRRQIHGC